LYHEIEQLDGFDDITDIGFLLSTLL
jgi:hypothetical protein